MTRALPLGRLARRPCPDCAAPIATVTDHTTGRPVDIETTFALDGTWYLTNLATATATETTPAPGLYRRHTCPQAPGPGGAR